MELKNSKRYIVIKFSELTLKGKNKKDFVKHLINNIQTKLDDKKIDAKVIDARDKLIVDSKNDLDKVPSVLKYITGISYYSYYFETTQDKESIENLLYNQLNLFPEETKFRVSIKNNDKNYTREKDQVIKWIAWFVSNDLNFKIDLFNYEVDVNLTFENNKTIVHLLKRNGINGFPSGVSGKSLALLSGGIDSPVAAFKTITRGMNTSFITFLTPRTSSSQTINKIKELSQTVNNYNGTSQKLFLVNFEKVQEEIMKLEDTSYRIILLRRCFVKFAQFVSKKYGYKFLVTGDALGQVASQTPESMTQIDNATNQLIIRPLITMSKNEIISIARDIKTYETSIKPGDDMCTIFTPRNPIIFPKETMVNELEKKLKNMDNLFSEVFEQDTRVLEIEGV